MHNEDVFFLIGYLAQKLPLTKEEMAGAGPLPGVRVPASARATAREGARRLRLFADILDPKGDE